MTQDTRLRLIHNWQDIEGLGGDDWLTPAERKLIAACKAGEKCALGEGTLPPEGPPDPNREIRANVLHYLILGGCDKAPVRGPGLQLIGGFITGQLNLNFARARGITGLLFCRFEQAVTALQTRFELLELSNCKLPALNAQGAQVTGGVFLRGLTAGGEVSLSGAKIGGQLSCEGAKFTATKGKALNAQRAQVTGDVFLTGITAKGEVSLSGAEIGGQLSCEGAKFTATKGKALNAQDAQVTPTTGDALNAGGAQVTGGVFLSGITAEGEVRLSGAEIGGQLSCEGATFSATTGHALNAQRLRVAEGLIWRNVKTPDGLIDFSSAYVGDLADQVECWPDGGRLMLDGFTYDRIAGAATDAKTRIVWLEKGSMLKGAFRPQPFTHLAKVLRGMGHEPDAQKVLVRRDRLLGEYARSRSWKTASVLWKAGLVIPHSLRILFDWLFRNIAGYGHRPILSLYWLIGLIMVAGVFAHLA